MNASAPELPRPSADTQQDDPNSAALVEIEQRAIGWILNDAPGAASCIEDCRDVAPQFHAPHDRIMKAVFAARGNGTEHSAAGIALAMANDEGLRQLGGMEYLRNLAMAAPTILNDEDGRAQFSKALHTYRAAAARDDLARRARDIAGSLSAGSPDAVDQLAELGLAATETTRARGIVAQPFKWREPSEIPTRKWLYGRHAIRGFVSATAAPGGIGKTALAIAESLALASGKNILNDAPITREAVWYIGAEDGCEEYGRRITAAALLHRLRPDDFTAGLFLNAGRAGEYIIASEDRDGLQIHRPIVSAIIENIRRNNIALVILDPFVSTHSIPESDNTMVAAVIREWASIADETHCGIELIHHVRKNSGASRDDNVDDARGASAFANACRDVRLLASMTPEEAARAGVEDRRRFFRVVSAKANLAPYVEGGAWRELCSVDLHNGDGRASDLVGAVAPFQMPDGTQIASPGDVAVICKRLAAADGRADAQAKAWAGYAVAEVLGLDPADKGVKENVRRALKVWIADGTLRVINRPDAKRMPRQFIVPSDTP